LYSQTTVSYEMSILMNVFKFLYLHDIHRILKFRLSRIF
jgi:hypothetical protein